MMLAKEIRNITLLPEISDALNHTVRRYTVPSCIRDRAQYVVLNSQGLYNCQITEQLCCHENTVSKWVGRFRNKLTDLNELVLANRQSKDSRIRSPGVPRNADSGRWAVLRMKTISSPPTKDISSPFVKTKSFKTQLSHISRNASESYTLPGKSMAASASSRLASEMPRCKETLTAESRSSRWVFRNGTLLSDQLRFWPPWGRLAGIHLDAAIDQGQKKTLVVSQGYITRDQQPSGYALTSSFIQSMLGFVQS